MSQDAEARRRLSNLCLHRSRRLRPAPDDQLVDPDQPLVHPQPSAEAQGRSRRAARDVSLRDLLCGCVGRPRGLYWAESVRVVDPPQRATATHVPGAVGSALHEFSSFRETGDEPLRVTLTTSRKKYFLAVRSRWFARRSAARRLCRTCSRGSVEVSCFPHWDSARAISAGRKTPPVDVARTSHRRAGRGDANDDTPCRTRPSHYHRVRARTVARATWLGTVRRRSGAVRDSI